MKFTGPTTDQPHRPAHVDITEDEATGDILDVSYDMERLKELVHTSYEIAKSKGWWDKERSFAALTLLMQSEISEALEDYRAKKGLTEVWYERSQKPMSDIPICLGSSSNPNDKFCGIPSELADVVIRIADFAGHYGLTLKPLSNVSSTKDFETSLARVSMQISRAFDTLDSNGLSEPGSQAMVSICLSLAVQHLMVMCEANGIDLWKAIQIKTEFNRTRPTRHGGKLI